jgi:hypothetical protein
MGKRLTDSDSVAEGLCTTVDHKSSNSELPLLRNQELFLLAESLTPGSCNMSVTFLAETGLPIGQLWHALELLVDRHDSLRLRLHRKRMKQSFSDRLRPEQLICVTDEAEIHAEANRPFELDEGFFFRCVAACADGAAYKVKLVSNHIVLDGPSLSILQASFLECVEAVGVARPTPPFLASSFQRFVAETVSSGAAARSASARDGTYWPTRLSGVEELTLPNTSSGSAGVLPIDAPVSGDFSQLARDWRATPFMVCVALFGLALGQRLEADELVFNCPVRSVPPEYRSTIGLLSTSIFLRIDGLAAGTASAPTVVRTVRNELFGALPHHGPLQSILESMAAADRRALTRSAQILVRQTQWPMSASPKERGNLQPIEVLNAQKGPISGFGFTYDLSLDLVVQPARNDLLLSFSGGRRELADDISANIARVSRELLKGGSSRPL